MTDTLIRGLQGLVAFALGTASVWVILAIRRYRGASASDAGPAYRWYQASFGFLLSLAAVLFSLRIPAACSVLIQPLGPSPERAAVSLIQFFVPLLWLPIGWFAIYGIATRRPITVAGIPAMIALFTQAATFVTTAADAAIGAQPTIRMGSLTLESLVICLPTAMWLVVFWMERPFWAEVSRIIATPPHGPMISFAFGRVSQRFNSHTSAVSFSSFSLFSGRTTATPFSRFAAPPSVPRDVDPDELSNVTPKPSGASVAWLDAAFATIPLEHRERASAVFSNALDARYHEALNAARSRKRPVSKDTMWMRKAFSLTPRPKRRALDRQISALLHPDAGGSEALFVAWKDTARRFPVGETEVE